MALSQLGQVALNKALATAAEMTRIAVTVDEKKMAAALLASLTKLKAAAGNPGQDALGTATEAKQAGQESFNRQYLELQQQMERENRSYTAISNIMKTKHDTVKNSISNIR